MGNNNALIVTKINIYTSETLLVSIAIILNKRIILVHLNLHVIQILVIIIGLSLTQRQQIRLF